MAYTGEQIKELKAKVFQTHKWPHYELLFDELLKLRQEKVAIVERVGLYGGSLFSPMSPSWLSFDISIYDEPFNAELIPHGVRLGDSIHCPYDSIHLQKVYGYDKIVVTNTMHHVPDPIRFLESLRLCDREIYIFDTCMSEYHQIPYHWGNMTPAGVEVMLDRCGFEVLDLKTTGNAFTMAAYFLNNAREYMEDGRLSYTTFHLMHRLIDLSDACPPNNPTRSKAQSPFAYWVHAK